ncbi:MAG: hypothetical protein V3V49_08935 [Candidatus Krumholzibacteria bacterium]
MMLGPRSWIRLALLTGLVLAGMGGCNRDVRLTGRKLRSVTVGPTTHYAMTLNEQASPGQVAYVLLRAIVDDFLAESKAEREAALDKQFDICAANVIQDRNRTALSRDEFVYTVVYHWTPTVSHYVHDFETEWEKARERFVLRGPRSGKGSDSGVTECEVLMEVEDPSGDPSARVVMVVYLAQDSGLWRVLHLGFDPTRRSIGN